MHYTEITQQNSTIQCGP